MELALKILLFTLTRAVANHPFYDYKTLISNNAKFVMFGDVTNFEDLLSVSLNYTEEFNYFENDESDEDESAQNDWFEKELKTINLLDEMANNTELLPDAKEYNDITKMFNFRRVAHYSKKAGWGGWFLSWMGISGNMGVWDDSDAYDIEEQKLDMMENCGFQFLLHARFKINDAIKQKAPFRGDKRYMLGYLFNRVRRVLYDQRKVVYIAMMTNKYRSRRKLRVLLRLYQQVARYDVDLVDLVRYIRRVYRKKADFDRYEVI